MKRCFEIEWKDSIGETWMNEGNLLICLNTTGHCGGGCILGVRDVTDVAPLCGKEEEEKN